MPVTIKKLRRVFRYNGTEIADPGPSLNADQALNVLAASYPALTNAIVEPPSIEGDKEVHVIKVSAGTKG